MKGIETAFIGRLGGDPQERMSAKGAVWASFTVAVDGNEEQPTWVKVAAFSDVARRCCAGMKKGSRCYVDGAIRLTDTDWSWRPGTSRRSGRARTSQRSSRARRRSGRVTALRRARRSATCSGPPHKFSKTETVRNDATQQRNTEDRR